ncbi:MAG: hypothetical protein ABJN40_05475 [Sneathiella sp.]
MQVSNLERQSKRYWELSTLSGHSPFEKIRRQATLCLEDLSTSGDSQRLRQLSGQTARRQMSKLEQDSAAHHVS